MDRNNVTKIVDYTNPETLGEVKVEVYREAFRKLVQSHYPHARIEFTDDPNGALIEAGSEDWDPIDEYEFLDQLSMQAWNSCL